MRRVVTGEELAQLYNPDPFAMPRWRSPVYRTPLGVIVVVKVFRLLGWLAGLIIRHPPPFTVMVLAALAWPPWPGRSWAGSPSLRWRSPP
jgi:hypothetical protein